MNATWLWIAQRASAAVLAVAVIAHLVTIVYASRGGLTAGEILERTQGNELLFAGYAVFALAVAVHVPIGLRTIALEWVGWRGRSLDVAAVAVGVVLGAAGLCAIWGLYR